MANVTERIPVEGVFLVEGEPTGDGRMFTHGSLNWDGVLPFALIWDRDEGDHSGMTVGAVEGLTRRESGAVWWNGYLSASDDPVTQAAVKRVAELMDEGAVGVSPMWDNYVSEIRVRRELVEMSNGADLLPEPIEFADDGRVIVARSAVSDVTTVFTAARPRHLAIVDTAAFTQTSIGRTVIGSIAASALVGDWAGREAWFANPQFGEPQNDDRLRYDPDLQGWSCPPTLTDDGRVFGHIAPMGICLRGRPDKCVTPPDGDLEGFMRSHAPAAGGLRTGVICVGGGHSRVGIGAEAATRYYDDTGRAVADVRVGKDRYGYWFAGMARPGASQDDLYTFAASDVSGHWEYSKRGRMTLVGLPAVNIGGYAKGIYTYAEFQQGLAASASLDGEEDCGCTADLMEFDIHERLANLEASCARIEQALAPTYGAHLAANLLAQEP